MKRSTVLLATAAAIGTLAGPAMAADDGYYKGRQVTIVVPSGSGGTYHLYC